MQVTGAVLAGGKSSRMGEDKAFLLVDGRPLIERVVAALREVFPEVMIAGDPEVYGGLAERVVPDIVPGVGPIGGIHTALAFASHELVFVAAADLPFADGEVARYIVQRAEGFDAAVPCIGGRLEPLFAAYRKTCRDAVLRCINEGRYRTVSFLGDVKVCYLTEPDFSWRHNFRRVFLNVNTPAEARRLQQKIWTSVPAVGVVGRSKAGKTRLIEGVVKELSRAGYRTAVLKHTRHAIRDAAGKDTFRFMQAGAIKTALAGPGGAYYFQAEGEPPLGTVIGLLEDGADIIIVEGYKDALLPQIRVADTDDEPEVDERTIAVVTEREKGASGPRIFKPDETAAITAVIVELLLRREDRGC
ncbi:MAG TPA: molybdopterin-guanine dinucleotide biosynthesis protein B [Desulfotomaculum sp.]|nr:molybdopterin-guanine dinucleotide biosynthesis protein B [Desulfotomaculum sp.]